MVGFMGMIHYLAALRLRGAKVVAICSRDRTKLSGDWRGIRGNFGPPGELMDLSGITTYENYADLIADPELDLIDICNPTHLHPSFAIDAIQSGKHVLVEKAIALTVAEADKMLTAAQLASRLCMVAHVLPYFPEFRFAAEVVQGGTYGKLLAAHFTRVIAQPDWSADFGDVAKTGGPAVDLHIHDTHFISLIAGVPRAVHATGMTDANGNVPYLTTHYLYGNGGPSISCTSGAISMPGRPFVHGYEIYLEKATLCYSSAGVPVTVYTADGAISQPTLAGGGDPISAFTDELQAAVDAVKSHQPPAWLTGQLARDALALCLQECESVKTGHVVPV
jgi:predicted dehydrogenase